MAGPVVAAATIGAAAAAVAVECSASSAIAQGRAQATAEREATASADAMTASMVVLATVDEFALATVMENAAEVMENAASGSGGLLLWAEHRWAFFAVQIFGQLRKSRLKTTKNSKPCDRSTNRSARQHNTKGAAWGT